MTPQFKEAVERFGPRFMKDLNLDILKVSGIFGNFAVESDQFRALQEYNPVVKGSKGGWGWAQWTGPRRRQFDTFADSNKLRRDDPEAFYQFVLHELATTEKAALPKLRATKTLDTATEAFMRGYERPGIPHLQARKDRALEALHVLEKHLATQLPAQGSSPTAVVVPPKAIPQKPTKTAPEAPQAKQEGWLLNFLKRLI